MYCTRIIYGAHSTAWIDPFTTGTFLWMFPWSPNDSNCCGAPGMCPVGTVFTLSCENMHSHSVMCWIFQTLYCFSYSPFYTLHVYGCVHIVHSLHICTLHKFWPSLWSSYVMCASAHTDHVYITQILVHLV